MLNRFSFQQLLKMSSYKSICLLIFCFVCISAYINQFTIIQIVSFLFYQYFLILFPGRIILFLFKKNGNEAIMAYIIGYIWSFFSYFICMVDLNYYQIIRISVVVLLYLVYYCKFKVKALETIYEEPFRKKDYILIIMSFICIYLLKLVIFNGANLSPEIIGAGIYNRDFMFYISNNASAMKTFPIETLYTTGNTLFYHYFTSLVVADGAMMCGMSAFDYTIGFSYIINVFVLGGAVVYFVFGFIKSKAFRFLALITILFASGFEHISLIYYLSHIYENPFGFDIGLAFACLSVLFFLKQHKNKFCIQNYILFLFFYILCCGSKGPVAVVVSSGIGICCLLSIAKEGNYKVNSIYLITIIVVFVYIYFFVISDIKAVGNDALHSMSLNITGTLGKVPFLKNLYNDLPFFKIINAVFAAIGWLIIANPIIAFLYFPMCLMRMIKKDFSYESLCFTVISITGIILTFIIHQHGFSQMYFLLSTIPFASIFIYQSLENIMVKKKIIMVFSVIIIAFTCITFFESNKGYLSIAKNKLLHHNGETASLTTINYITKNIMDGMYWLKSNTEEGDIFFTNVSISYPKAQIYAALAERPSFLEGYDLIDVNKINIDERKEAMLNFIISNGEESTYLKKQGVLYYVEFNWFDKKIDIKNASSLEVSYQNEELIIYKVK